MTTRYSDHRAAQAALQGRIRAVRVRLLKARGRRQMPVPADADPTTLAQAIDRTLAAALAQRDVGDDTQAWQLVAAAAATVDALLAAYGVPDSDEMGGQQ